MSVQCFFQDGVLTACLHGEIDHHHAEALRDAIDKQIQQVHPSALFLDFGGVRFMDSSGIGLILGRYRLMRQMGGEVSVGNLSPQMQRIIALSGVGKLVTVEAADRDIYSHSSGEKGVHTDAQ